MKLQPLPQERKLLISKRDRDFLVANMVREGYSQEDAEEYVDWQCQIYPPVPVFPSDDPQ